MKSKKLIIVIVVLLVVAAAVFAIVKLTGKKEVSFNTTTVGENTVEITVMATGYVQPVEKVDVGTQVSGVIETIYVDYNSVVTVGQVLAELDRSTLLEKVSQAKAQVSSAQSDLTYATQNFERVKMMFDNKAATKASYDESVNKLAQAKTSVINAKANLQQAEVNLSYAIIKSPINGVVLERAVNVGQTVASSFNTPTLFTIAEDLTKMQVEADVDEADIGKVRVGQKVTFTVDAYSIDVFEGVVEQIRLQPVVTSNVVTYTVIIEAPNPDLKLFPGMTANINIVAESETGLSVPVEAINFTMPDNVAAEAQQEQSADEGPKAQHGENREVWVLKNGKPQKRDIKIGINDGVNTIVYSGVESGEEVVLSVSTEKKGPNQAVSNPLVPGGRRR